MAQTVHNFDAIDMLDHLSGLQLANLCGLRLDEVQDLVDYGVLQCAFAREGLDYDLDLFSVVIVVQYLREIEDLKLQLSQYQAQR